MFKLLLVFGVLVNPYTVDFTRDIDGDCIIVFSSGRTGRAKNKTCAQVWKEINIQAEGSSNDNLL